MITRNRHLMGIGAAAVLALVMSGCAGGALSTTDDAADGDAGAEVEGIDTSNCPSDFNSIGITDDTVKIGSSSPKSGAAAIPLAIGIDAYIEMQNSAGGFEFGDGKTRMVENTVLDDARETSRTRANVEQLIDQEQVFALVGMSGTASNLAIRPIVDENCIPSVYMDSGNNEMGNPDFPWSLAPILPANAVDARVAADLIEKDDPEAKIALLVQNDDLGKALTTVFDQALEGTDMTVVAKETFEPTDTSVSGQITTLANSGATHFAMFSGNGTFQLQALESIAQSGWEPAVKYLTLFRPSQLKEVSEGARTEVFFARWVDDPTNPAVVESNEEMQTFLEWYDKQPEASSFDPTIAQFGWMAMRFLSENFKEMKTPTRTALIEAARTLTWDGPSLYVEGITYDINWPEYPFGIETLQVLQYNPDNDGEVLVEPIGVVDMSETITFIPPAG